MQRGALRLRGQGLLVFLPCVPPRPQRDAVRSPFEVLVRRLHRSRRGGKKRLQSKRADLVDREDLFAGAAFGKFSHDLYHSMSSKSLEGKVGVVFGVANKRSIAWAIAFPYILAM